MKSDMRTMIGQHLVGGFPGTEISADFARLVRDYKIGNVTLFQRNIESEQQLTRLCEDIQELMLRETGHPAFIMIDEEGGNVIRLPESLCGMPGAMAIAATGKTENAQKAARLTAGMLKECGVNFNLAPVVDVNSNSQNPVIGARSYGDQPQCVADYAAAAVEGYLQEGMIACAKHYPGHGDTAVDSHLGLPVVDKTLEELTKTDLVPFRAVIEAGIPAIMTAHILYPAIEAERVPCTMSRKLITGLLRETLGFKGLIVSDCTEMEAIKRYYGTANGVAAALAAGVDMVLICHTAALIEESAKKVEEAVSSGAISLEELCRSTEKILSFKEKYCGDNPCKKHTEVSSDFTDVKCKENVSSKNERNSHLVSEIRSFARQVRKESMSLTQGEIFRPDEKTFFTGCSAFRGSLAANEENGRDSFPGHMAARFGGSYQVSTQDPSEEEITQVVRLAQSAETIVMCICDGHLHPRQMDLVSALAQSGKPMMVVSMRAPYDLAELPIHVTGIAAWDYKEETLSVLAELFAAKETPSGRLPVKLFVGTA